MDWYNMSIKMQNISMINVHNADVYKRQVVAVSAVTGIVSFVTRESRQSQVSSKKSAEKDSSEPTLTDTVKQSRSDLEADERTPEEILAEDVYKRQI